MLDAADRSIFTFVGADFDDYQSYDKALDVYYLAIAYASTLRNWPRGLAFVTARFLWYYRLVGVAAYELTGTRALLFIFPNTFEYFFLAYELVRLRWDPQRLSGRQVLALAAGLWVFVKLPQEWWIHVARLDVTEQVAAHPGLAGAVLLVVLAAAGAAALWLRRRGPSPDSPATTAVDRHLPRIGAVGPAVPIPLRSRRFVARVGEKILLIALTVVIFSQVLPDVRATVTQIATGTALVVLANAVASQAFARNETRWGSTLSQFAAMGVVNVGIVAALRLLPGERGASFDTRATLFFVLLLTLLVTLVDRYRTVRRERFSEGYDAGSLRAGSGV